LGRHDEALEAYKRATEVDPENARAWSGVGDTLEKLGRHEEALEAYKRATEVDPENAWAWGGVGDTLEKLGRHDEALDFYARAIRKQWRRTRAPSTSTPRTSSPGEGKPTRSKHSDVRRRRGRLASRLTISSAISRPHRAWASRTPAVARASVDGNHPARTPR